MLGPWTEHNDLLLLIVTESGPIVNNAKVIELNRERVDYQSETQCIGEDCGTKVTIACADTGKQDLSKFSRKIYTQDDKKFIVREFRDNSIDLDRIEIEEV